jgi:hypothetical protein
MLFATKTSCLVRSSMRTKSSMLSLRVLFLRLLLFNPRTMMSVKPCDNCNMIMVTYADLWLIHSHVASLLDCARLELRDSKLVPHFWVLALAARFLDLIWRLRPLRLRILSINLIILLATQFYPLLAKHVFLSRVSLSMLPKKTPSFCRFECTFLHV